MTGLVFASREEAEPFLARYERGRFADLTEGDTAHDPRLVVTLTGVGKIKAVLRTERLLQAFSPERIVHVGTCTALKTTFAPGQWVGATEVLEGDRMELSAPSYPRLPLAVPFESPTPGTLVTQDHTPADGDEHSYWQRIADVSDTTGYAVAYVAATHGVPCHIAKVVTSHLHTSDATDFQERLHAGHHAIADFLLDWLERESKSGRMNEWKKG